jgi:hypothetical protein
LASASLEIVKKVSPEFKAACKQYLKLFFDSKQEDYIKKGEFTQGENKGKFLAMTSKKILEAKLPLPFGCSNLCIQPCIDDKTGKLTGVIWFCDRVGCICVSCREDFTEEYPTNCPNLADVNIPCDGECDGCVDKYNCPDSPRFDEGWDEELEDMEPDW